VALLTAWEPQLQQLFTTTLATQQRATTARQQTSTQEQQSKQGQQQQQLQQQQLCLLGFLEFLQGRGAIPQLLEPADVQEVLRQLLATQADQVGVFVDVQKIGRRMGRTAY
jgi:hypothetical protein